MHSIIHFILLQRYRRLQLYIINFITKTQISQSILNNIYIRTLSAGCIVVCHDLTIIVKWYKLYGSYML